MGNKKNKQQKQKAKPQKLSSLNIPSSPSTTSKTPSAVPPDSVTPGDVHSGPPSPFETPPTSPPTVATEISPMDSALPVQGDSSSLDSQGDNKGSEVENVIEDQAQAASPDQTQLPAQGTSEESPKDPWKVQDEPGLLDKTEDAALEFSEDTKEPEIPDNHSPSQEDSGKTPLSANRADLSHSPVQGDDDTRSGGESGDQSELPGEGQPPSDSIVEEETPQSNIRVEEHWPSDSASNEECIDPPSDGPQVQDEQPPPPPPPKDDAEKIQTPVQELQPPEEGQPPPVPMKDEAQMDLLEENNNQTLEQDLPPDVDQQILDSKHEPEYEPEKVPELSMQSQDNEKPLSPITASDVTSKDILSIANALSTMRSTLSSMTIAFDRLGQHAENMVFLTLDLKAEQQIRQIQLALEQQITRHMTEIESLRSVLRDKIKQAVEEKIRNELMDVVRGSLKQVIEEKVREQLSIQIPENLRQQVISHQRQILEVKTSLHNSEARRHNSLQTVPGPHARLRPLLRPLPTPEQSPVILISRSNSMEPSTFPTPTTAFPQVPAPTPIKRVSSNSLRSALMSETTPPTSSRLFPRDLNALFALSQEEAKTLLREYGLDSATCSPTKESARLRGLSVVSEESSDTAHDEDPDVHARDLNKFMAHIGVPFLMIPAPKEKANLSAPLSSRSRRKMLTPLIIK